MIDTEHQDTNAVIGGVTYEKLDTRDYTREQAIAIASGLVNLREDGQLTAVAPWMTIFSRYVTEQVNPADEEDVLTLLQHVLEIGYNIDRGNVPGIIAAADSVHPRVTLQ